ncbi:MAG: bifunctional [glutamate--ammonia ligase]-adenylyl-L-tyrosine phosphorylase/[glutamate--ammonia-ligase] adenylyltransferase [Planctomycetota bacterium]|nr:bifunctional [glutamate--ammonia ligase]-adenylyl-L-tyrosine phosphorylase/[glutamate--ammonia-ligase] adenylyltransferase [Planctomycetota bacterium]
MELEQVIRFVDDPAEVTAWLRSLNVRDAARGRRNFLGIANSGITPDLLMVLCRQLGQSLSSQSDPEMALNHLDRFFAASRNPLALGSLFERDPEALPTLLQIFSASQYLSDLLIRDPESFDLLRVTAGQPVTRKVLLEEICAAVAQVEDDRDILTILRRHKHRETLRIAYGDIVLRQRLEIVTEQISFLAEALCEAAVRAARRKLEQQRGVPRRPDGKRARLVVLALGKLGGRELNYSSDIDLVFLSDDLGQTDAPRPITHAEFCDRLARQVIKYLTENTDLGVVYRVDLRLCPEGRQASPVVSLSAALHYYDVFGRTWERQAFVKARPVAGDLDLGREFLAQLEPWIYRRYLTRADITGIRALKRQIEQRTNREGGDERNVETGHGGIRDIEFVIQFLQLLNGGDLPEIRTGNTLEAMARLEQAGCLTLQEHTTLRENYELLRKLEHRLQIMCDLQTHSLPEQEEELRKLAIRMGYAEGPHRAPLEAFKADYKQKTERNRKILNYLLNDAFGTEEGEPEVDLVLDPDPLPTTIHEVLGRYGFQKVDDAYQQLLALSKEKISFLSTRRCRHFLAAIAPQLLQAICATPDPDSTLADLSKVSDSLGGKGVLWELFSVNPPTLQLYVRLCAATPYLSGILTSNPGMLDELMDSLLLDKLPTLASLERALEDLLRGAEDSEPILHGFKNSLHLRVGVRDVLGKADIRHTHCALSDIAEVCLAAIAQREYEKLASKFGTPTIAEGGRAGRPCELIILALGKLGGREPNYHSDLDVVFLYEADGTTRPASRSRSELATTHQHFFSQLGQRIIKVISQWGPHGRLYELDPRLRPIGKSGSLAVSQDEFARYFASGSGQPWERQALCKARPIYGSARARQLTMQVIRQAIVGTGWQSTSADQLRGLRTKLEETATPRNLKRGPGGTLDVEFAVQMLQLKHAAEVPAVLVPGTLDAIEALQAAQLLGEEAAAELQKSYRFLRAVEARLRLMNTTARHDLPEHALELKKLAYLLNYADAPALIRDCEQYTRQNRLWFDRLFDQARRQ